MLRPGVWAGRSTACGIFVNLTYLGIYIHSFLRTVLVGEDAIDGAAGAAGAARD